MILTCKYLQTRKAPGGVWTGWISYCNYPIYLGKDCKGAKNCEFFVDYDEYRKRREKWKIVL